MNWVRWRRVVCNELGLGLLCHEWSATALRRSAKAVSGDSCYQTYAPSSVCLQFVVYDLL